MGVKTHMHPLGNPEGDILNLPGGILSKVILALERRWDFVGCKVLEKFFGTYPSTLRCYIKCYALTISAPGPAVAEKGGGDVSWFHPQRVDS